MELAVILDAIAAGIAVLDQDGRILAWNQWLVRHSGISEDIAIGRPLTEIFPELSSHPRMMESLHQSLSHCLASIISPSIHRPPLPLYRDGAKRQRQERLQQLIHITPIRINGLTACMLQVQDVTAAVQREQRLRDQSAELVVHNQQLNAQLQEIHSLQAEIAAREAQDPLTGVLNRRFIDKRLKALLQTGTPTTLMMVDVDLLKRINENHGFSAGDVVIQALATHLKNSLPSPGCSLGRYESDAFLLLLPDIALERSREWITQCHQTFVSQPVMHEGTPLSASFSAGLAFYPKDGASESELIQCLDLTLFLARHEGGNRILAYDDARNSMF